MAGVGVKLNHIFEKNTLTTNLVGFGYSTAITIAPMILVIAAIVLMQYLLGFSKVGYASRELFACTVLYVFIFSLLTASPFNSVLSKYVSDVIYNETYEDIIPCYNVGLIMNMALSCLLGIPFCIWEYFVGKVSVWYVFAGYCGFVALVLVFYSMLYLSICKDYKKISFFFFIGMLVTILMSLIFVNYIHMEVTFSMMVALDIGFLLIASLESAIVRSYFRVSSRKYKEVILYFKKFWKLAFTNFFYTLGMYIHNFVFWTTDMHMIVVKSFVCVTAYDLATCLAMFTNISSSVIFISRVEMHFHDRYKAYSEAVIGGRGMDIENAKRRMFRQLAEQLMDLVRIQFIISVVLFLICVVLLPQFGYGGLTMKIYPCLAAGYFILFIMYAAIIFLYYFNDMTGSLLTAFTFCLTTLVCSIGATMLPSIWYGMGLFIGAFVGFCVAYKRLQWLEKHFDVHVFCEGTILKQGHGPKPEAKVFDRYAREKKGEKYGNK